MTTEQRTVRQLLDQLGERRDEIRVQLHLAGMDVKQEWDRLETKLRGIAELEGLADHARLQLHLARMDAKDELKVMGKTLDAIADGIERESDTISHEVRDAIHALTDKVHGLVERNKSASA